jgi:hypothetical protein
MHSPHENFEFAVKGCGCEACKLKRKNPFDDMKNPDYSPKPPTGVMPRWRHEELRIIGIDNAILRFKAAGKPVPEHWVHERAERQQWLSWYFTAEEEIKNLK